MKIQNFMQYDEFQVIFPETQDDTIRLFGMKLKKLIGPECEIIRKATYEMNKKNIKDKDILLLKFQNSIKGLIGLIICLNEFEELIEIRAIRNLHNFDVPQEIRYLNNIFFDYINGLIDNFKGKNKIEVVRLKKINSEFLIEIKELIKKNKVVI